MNEPTSVLVISHDVVDAKMAGPGIRYWELARVLAQHFQVTLAVPGNSSLGGSGHIDLWPYQVGRWASLSEVAEEASVILLCGDVLAWFPQLEQMDVPLVVDGYDPHTLETLAMFAGTPEQEQRHQERERILRAQCRAGDFFICASERQRDWWLGLLEATGRINAQTYNEDPSLRNLVDVVPFGLPSSRPRHTQQVLKGVQPGIGREDRVVLWGGGLWEWLDPLTAVRAMTLVCKQRDDVRLVFPGTRHPNPAVPDSSMRRSTLQLAEERGLLDEHVFFGDWVPYHEWPNYLLESDVGLSLHLDTIETRLAFRSRVLDYVWAGLPMVLTRGDTLGLKMAGLGLGEVVGYQAEEELAAALLRLLAQSPGRLEKRFEEVRSRLMWEKAAGPLIDFCRDPRLAADEPLENSYQSSVGVPDSPADADVTAMRRTIARQERKMARLREQVAVHEHGRFVRLMKWLHGVGLGRGNR